MFKPVGRNELEVVHEKYGSDSEETESNDNQKKQEIHATTVG